jgi:hypothetical protein
MINFFFAAYLCMSININNSLPTKINGRSLRHNLDSLKNTKYKKVTPLTDDACFSDIEEGTKKQTDPDHATDCPPAYVALYQGLLDAAAVGDLLDTYVAKCTTKTCAEGCYELTVSHDATVDYTTGDKSNFRSNCKPAGANLLTKDICYEEDDTPLDLVDDTNDCPSAYVALYNNLLVIANVETSLSEFKTKCPTKTCDTGCYELTVAHDSTAAYTGGDKTNLKSKCKPTGASALKKDVCYEQDETKITGQTDTNKCQESYDKLIAALPATAEAKHRKRNAQNKTFLDDPQTLFNAFTNDCSQTICSSDACYDAILKIPPTQWTFDLRTAITTNCEPPPPPPPTATPSEGTLRIRVHNILALLCLMLMTIQIRI